MPLRKLFMRKLDCSLPRVLYGQYVGLKAIDTNFFSLSWAVNVLWNARIILIESMNHLIKLVKGSSFKIGSISPQVYLKYNRLFFIPIYILSLIRFFFLNWIKIRKWKILVKPDEWNVSAKKSLPRSPYSIWRVTNYRYVPLCTVKKDALGTWHISLKRTAFSPRAFFTPMSSISAFCFFKKALQEIFLSFSLLASTTTTIKI